MAGVVVLSLPALGQEAELDCDAPSVLPAPADFAARCGLAVPEDPERLDGLEFPGDTAFYKNNYPPPLDFKTAPLPTLTFTFVAAQPRPLFAMAFDASATTLYAVDNTSRQLGTLDTATGAFTPIGVLNPDPAGLTVAGLTFDPISGIAYFTATNGTTANLYTINVSNAALTLIGPITGFSYTIDIAIDRSGQMWGHDINQDVLIAIDKNTAAATSVGPTGLAASFAQGMMYDSSDDTLYGCAFVTSPAQQGELVVFDRTTGGATIVGGPVPDEMECSIRAVPAITLTKTVGTVPAACAGTDTITVPLGTPVTYCYQVANTGGVAFDVHTLFDDQLGPILINFSYLLAPGAGAYLTVDNVLLPVGVTINTGTWTATRGTTSSAASDTATVTVLDTMPFIDGFETGTTSQWSSTVP